ncbi:MAG TPA: hypothetical protein VGH31_02740 [Acidimicrobiales bacterium]
MSSTETFRTIDELAQQCGHYCWVETRLFEITGQWASGDGPAEWRLFCSVISGQHAALATQWRSRLPVRAGVDQQALIRQPETMGSAVTALGGQTIEAGLPVLLQEVLPELVLQYRQLLDEASPVREAPVIASLTMAVGTHADSIPRVPPSCNWSSRSPGFGTF